MKVKAKWKYHEGKRFELGEVETTYCCTAARNSEAVTFGEIDSNLNRNEHVNISSCAPYPEGAVWEEEEINFCPFCGTKVEIEIQK